MRSNRREELVASAADRALAAGRDLERRSYALASSIRPDGRAHASPTLFCPYPERFWVPTLGGATRLGNVQA
jgi:hypothetical protein